MEDQLRSNYTLQGISHALNVYNFPQDHMNRKKVQVSAYRYLFMYRNRSVYKCPSPDELTQRCIQLFDSCQRSDAFILYELADIVNTYGTGERDILLNRLREMDIEMPQPLQPRGQFVEPPIARPIDLPVPKSKIKSVYTDKQNVHNSTINKTAISAITHLYRMYQNRIPETIGEKDKMANDFFSDLGKRYNTYILERNKNFIQTNVSVFGEENVCLQDIFLSLMLWINEPERKDVKLDLEKRLVEEMESMANMCSTGHANRYINVIQGYTEDEKLCIRISDKEQCSSTVRQYLTKALQECKDEQVMEGMLEGTQVYKNFIYSAVEKQLIEWKNRFGSDMLDYIAEVVNDFAGMTIFKKEPEETKCQKLTQKVVNFLRP